tara:strand:- start:848 stop:1258 length:411 start_codon:yes stop_codon:yes gene_type:complete
LTLAEQVSLLNSAVAEHHGALKHLNAKIDFALARIKNKVAVGGRFSLRKEVHVVSLLEMWNEHVQIQQEAHAPRHESGDAEVAGSPGDAGTDPPDPGGAAADADRHPPSAADPDASDPSTPTPAPDPGSDPSGHAA